MKAWLARSLRPASLPVLVVVLVLTGSVAELAGARLEWILWSALFAIVLNVLERAAWRRWDRR